MDKGGSAASGIVVVCPECGRRYDALTTCIGSFPSRHARHAEAICVPEVTEAMIQAGAAALKPYLDHATFRDVVGDDHDIASAVLRAALAKWTAIGPSPAAGGGS